MGRALAWGQLAIFVSTTQILFEVLGDEDELTGITASKPINQERITNAVLDRLEGIPRLEDHQVGRRSTHRPDDKSLPLLQEVRRPGQG